MANKKDTLHTLKKVISDISELSNVLGYNEKMVKKIKRLENYVDIAYSLLEQAADEIASVRGEENTLVKRIRQFIKDDQIGC